MNMQGKIVAQLLIHAATTAKFALDGNLGTAIDRADVLKVVANTIEPLDAPNALLLRNAANFGIAAGLLACGSRKGTDEQAAETIALIKNGNNALQSLRIDDFNTINEKVIKLIEEMDETAKKYWITTA